MPVYNYKCEACGVKWEKAAPISARSKPCPSCKTVLEPLMPDTISGVFNQAVKGAGPQNTGIHDLDTHIDRVIGRSSEQGWETIEKRNVEKQRILRGNPGKTKEDLAKSADGSYRIMQSHEMPIKDRVNSLAMSQIKRREP